MKYAFYFKTKFSFVSEILKFLSFHFFQPVITEEADGDTILNSIMYLSDSA